MATIYRIAIEQSTKATGQDGRKGGNRLGTGKQTAKSSSLGVGPRGGVEHNRKMRAINPVLNKATNGYWEKGMRIGRAGMGLARNVQENGIKGIFTGPSIAIIVAFILMTLMKWQSIEMEKARRQNEQNYKQLENGVGAIHSAYSISINTLTGRQTYNQNK